MVFFDGIPNHDLSQEVPAARSHCMLIFPTSTITKPGTFESAVAVGGVSVYTAEYGDH